MSENKYVRLKPYDPKNGCVVRRYLYRGKAFVTDNETGRPVWYVLNEPKLLAELAALRQYDGNSSSPPLFDILDESEYSNAVAEEERRRLVQLGIMTSTSVQPAAKTPTVDRTGGRSAAIPEAAEVAPALPAADADDAGDDDSGAQPEPAAEARPRRGRRRGFGALGEDDAQ